MINSLGRMWMKTRRTHGDIVCVCGERKWTFSTTTVTQMLGRERKKAAIHYWIFLPKRFAALT